MSEQKEFTYKNAGININDTDAIKESMGELIKTDDSRVLNGLGPFASLYDISFPEIREPVLVLKAEEPGSKQKLAAEYGYTESVCHDMINHLVNDTVVMGATPLAVLDVIVTGAVDGDTLTLLVKGMRDACRENECALVGGETSIQPQVLDANTYVLTSSMAGIVEKSRIIDGSKIEIGDAVLAVASNGLHTNGYTLVRMLMDSYPEIKDTVVSDGETFLQQIMRPHTPYYKAIKGLLGTDMIHGMAHITGGGIEGNLCRIIPEGMKAEIDLSKIRMLPLFKFIRARGNVADAEMLKTFNCGVGFNIVVPQEHKQAVMDHVNQWYDCYEIGTIVESDVPGIKPSQTAKNIRFVGQLEQ
ncbi:MAG: phosphoribosylformylglycinamidine cyclo-ligase [Oscillospiraceae bacterium]|nr:phosphoribosylformylglycinamidine cyclo-ligase [Oscillospiraceae bacterium]